MDCEHFTSLALIRSKESICHRPLPPSMQDQAKSWSGIAGNSRLRVPAKISLSCKAVSTTCLCSPMISIESLAEGVRVLRENGLLLLIEPWATLFLSVTHAFCRIPVIRALSPKIDALASMIHYERQTYENWLSHPRLILDSLAKVFRMRFLSLEARGEVFFLGRKRSG